VVVCGCANRTPLDVDTCGNGVIELGEDCDSFVDPELGANTSCGASESAPVQRCHYVCDAEQACPIGWGCGVDGVCRHAIGELKAAPGTPSELNAERFVAGDVDDDGVLDLIGMTRTAIAVRSGEGTGRFGEPAVFTTPITTGWSSFGDVDGDAGMDAIVPIGLGVLGLAGDAERTFRPIAAAAPIAVDSIPGADDVRVVSLLPDRAQGQAPLSRTAMVVSGPAGPAIAMGAAGPVVPIPGVAFDVDDLAEPLCVANIHQAPERNGEELVLAVAGRADVLVYELATDGESIAVVAEIATAPLGPVLHGVHVVDVDGDAAADLLISVADADTDRVAVAYGDGLGSFSTPVVDERFDALLAGCNVEVDEVCRRWPTLAADFDGDGIADFVATNAVYLATGATTPLVHRADNPLPEAWVDAVSGDFNRDGRVDFAAVSEGQVGIDVLLGDGAGLFNPIHSSSLGVVSSIATGDFDGDFTDDIAVIEHAASTDQVSVAFGSGSGQPEPLVTMLRAPEIRHFGAGYATQVYPDVITDLVVQTVTEDGAESMYVALNGTPERRMVAPFGITGSDAPFVPDVVLLGELVPGSDAQSDIVAISGAEDGGSMWLFEGARSVGMRQPTPDDAISLEDALGEDAFSAECAVWAVGDVDGDGADEIVAVDNNDDCFDEDEAVDEARMAIIDPGGTHRVFELTDGRKMPLALELADLDADGDLDVVVVFRGELADDDGLTVGAGVTAYFNDGGFDPERRSSVVGSGPGERGRPTAATVLNADSDPALEVAFLDGYDLFIADLREDATFAAGQTPSATLSVGFDVHAVTGDFDGDGVDDMAFSDEHQVDVVLGISHTEER
jgi:hypothetical protein